MPNNAIAALLILCHLMLITTPARASNPYYNAVHCFDERLNNPQEGDIAKCRLGDSQQYMCPINSVACQNVDEKSTAPAVCPRGYTQRNNRCEQRSRVCLFKPWSDYWEQDRNGVVVKVKSNNRTYRSPIPAHLTRGRRSLANKIFEVCDATTVITTTPTCNTGSYNAGTKRCDITASRPACPLGGQYQCIASGSASYCSPNRCFDPQSDKETIEDNINGELLINNGAVDEEGLCLDKVYIFNGRAQKCRPSGAQTGFKSCCATDGEVLKDSSGASMKNQAMTQGISAVYQATAAAYSAYAGGSALFPAASTSATSAFGSGFVGAFDPTSLAIAIAVALIMDYLAKACDPIETETAIANSSGRCVFLGEMCAEKWLGKCVQKQKSFCCYNSKLGAIINKQGRMQLNTFKNLPNGGFGDVNNPQCRGFTPEEFQALDFSNIDLSEYYDVLVHRSQSQIEDTMNKLTTEHFNNVQ